MLVTRFRPLLVTGCAVLFAGFTVNLAAATHCVNTAGSGGCYSKIQTAVGHAAAYDVINVAAGTYKEDVVIGIPLSIIGASPDGSAIISATGLANGFVVDGYHHPGLHAVTIAGFTVENAQFEGVLVVSASDVTIRDNHMIDNDKFGGVFSGLPTGCLGQPAYETDETGDCGGALHLIGTANSIVSGNYIAGNADGILISDETMASHDNLLIHNTISNNPLECGIVLASHGPVGSSPPHFAPHYGVFHNTVAENISADNGVQVGGAGVGLFSDGNGPGRVSENVIIHNSLTGNGIGGVSLHTHVGPNFGAPADNMDDNMIIGNYIAGNLADTFDTATPGRVGININSGGGGSPVWGTVISQNEITDEDVDVAVNTPATVNVHLNNLLGGHLGAANICAFDGQKCIGSINATVNYWGCDDGPGHSGCTSTSGPNVRSYPWLQAPTPVDSNSGVGDND